MPGTFHCVIDGTFVSATAGTFHCDMGGTFGALLSKQEPFSPYRDIHETIHRKALELAFEGRETISGYKALEEELTTAYELAGTKFNHNKIVKIIQFLTNKRMVVQESRGIYRFMPDYHY